MAFLYSRLTNADCSGVLALQEKNLVDNLDVESRRDGFLSARFSWEQLQQMDQDVAVLVARDADRVAGYLCASGVELNRQYPLLGAMIDVYDRLCFEGHTLAEQKTFVYGPACVDSDFRGRGILRGLFRALLSEIEDRFEAGVAFVAEDNPRSLGAHVAGLGMQDIGHFEFKNKRYRILAFAAASQST